MIAPLGMLVVLAVMLLDLRHEACVKAEQTSRNLLQVLEHDLARNVEIYDFSLRGVIEAMRTPGALDAAPALRQLMLFDRAAMARDTSNGSGATGTARSSVRPRATPSSVCTRSPASATCH